MTKPLTKKRKKTGVTCTGELLATLAYEGESDAGASLASRLGPLSHLTEAECKVEMDRLWKIHGAAATQWHINRAHNGTRPYLWWKFDAPQGRLPVRRSSGTSEDSVRHSKERLHKDLAILIRHDLLTGTEKETLKAELAALAEEGISES